MYLISANSRRCLAVSTESNMITSNLACSWSILPTSSMSLMIVGLRFNCSKSFFRELVSYSLLLVLITIILCKLKVNRASSIFFGFSSDCSTQIVKWNLDPSLNMEVTQIEPPIKWINFLEMDNPNPVPPNFLVVDPSA
ncbi:hypothetical protein WICPIJ_009836 [Wickerhamomyces pijperi]|uniref:Uncharacterized protein n=1 Tax=Wickerhamomyces pijperi TaxID=599730 RepID=A0A9P8TC77_WICPI|nr:hypothetical protein WICPIJ_009836 [Wickerhamomyces pijperi]